MHASSDRRPHYTVETRRRDENVHHRGAYNHQLYHFARRDCTTNRQNYYGGGSSRSQRHGGWGAPPSNPMHGAGSAPSMQSRLPIPPHSYAPAQHREVSKQYNAKIKVAHWTEALRLLNEMRQKGFPPNVFNYNCAINRCAKGGKWQCALDLLDEMRSRRLAPDEITYSSVINACAKGDEWRRALGLLEEMRTRGLVPNEITYTSVIDACAKGGEWWRSLELFDEMLSYNLTPDSIAYDAALNACAIGRQPERALSLFESLQRERLTPDVSHWSHLLDAIGPNHAQSRSLLLRMVGQPFFAGAESIEAGVPEFDLHGLSTGAAEMVVHWWLREKLPQRLEAGKMSEPTHVVLVTGHGESRVLKEAGVVKQRVLELASVRGTVVEHSNRGCVVLASPLTGGCNASATV